MAKASTRKVTVANVSEEAPSSIDQIRELLFGETQRRNNNQLADLDKALKRHSAEAERRLNEAQDALQQRLEDATSSISDRLDALNEKLDDAAAAASQDNEKAVQDLTAAIDGAETSLSESLRTEAKALQDQLDALRAEHAAALAKLDQEKTAKAQLGAFLVDLGHRLAENGHDATAQQDGG